MNTTVCLNADCLGGPRPVRPKVNLSPWITLFAVLAGVLVFMYVIGPWGLETSTMKPVATAIEDYGIEANAYYYTEVPEFADAQMFFSNNRRYPTEMQK